MTLDEAIEPVQNAVKADVALDACPHSYGPEYQAVLERAVECDGKLEEQLPAILSAMREAQAIIAKLPKTADGVAVVPGDAVWHPRHIGRSPCIVYSNEHEPTEYEVTIVLSFGADNFIDRSDTVPVTECFSNRKDAKAAMAKM